MKEKENKAETISIPDEVLMGKIYQIRGQKVMLDSDLSELYGVENKRLKEQVRRNIERFPEDFMFELTEEEHIEVKARMAPIGRGAHSKYLPFVFTEHGVLMLSSILNSERAIQVNIRVVRIYVRMREITMLHRDLLQRIKGIEGKLREQDNQFMIIFEYLKQFEEIKHDNLEKKNRPKIGYRKQEK